MEIGELLKVFGIISSTVGISMLIIFYNIREHRGYFKRDMKELWSKITNGNNLDIVLRSEFYHDENTKQQRFIFEFYLGKLWYILCWLALIGILLTGCKVSSYNDPTRPGDAYKHKLEQQKKINKLMR